jgi:hypothetical protein
MQDAPTTGRRSLRRAVAAVAALVPCVGMAVAQTTEQPPPPVGIAAGPVVFAPSLTAGYAYDSNIFLRSDASSPVADQVLTLQPAIVLTVPFSNSQFVLADTLRWLDYKNTPQVSGRTSNEASAELDLKFSTFDLLQLSARRIAGVAETLAFDPGGEVLFNGQSYRLHNEAVSVARELFSQRGYRFALARNVLEFDPSQEASFFNYSGFDGDAAFLQPLSSNTRLSFGYLGTRYDHFDTSPGADPHEVYRTERGDAVYGTLDGRLGPRQSYDVRVGWEWLGFTGNSAADYSGIILRANASFVVGGGTTLAVTAIRQPYRSFFLDNNFYVFNALGLAVQRAFPHGSTIGANANVARNAYGEPVPQGQPAAGTKRADRAIWIEGYANLAIRERVAFRISIRKNTKASNYPGADFDDVVVFGGFVLGWY